MLESFLILTVWESCLYLSSPLAKIWVLPLQWRSQAPTKISTPDCDKPFRVLFPVSVKGRWGCEGTMVLGSSLKVCSDGTNEEFPAAPLRSRALRSHLGARYRPRHNAAKTAARWKYPSSTCMQDFICGRSHMLFPITPGWSWGSVGRRGAVSPTERFEHVKMAPRPSGSLLHFAGCASSAKSFYLQSTHCVSCFLSLCLRRLCCVAQDQLLCDTKSWLSVKLTDVHIRKFKELTKKWRLQVIALFSDTILCMDHSVCKDQS